MVAMALTDVGDDDEDGDDDGDGGGEGYGSIGGRYGVDRRR